MWVENKICKRDFDEEFPIFYHVGKSFSTSRSKQGVFERRHSLGCLPSSMRKAMLVAAIALVLGSTVTASDNARDWPHFDGPQQYLISNLGEVLREQHALESCSQQQREALQRFLNMGISYNAAALMAHSQYPCDSTDQ